LARDIGQQRRRRELEDERRQRCSVKGMLTSTVAAGATPGRAASLAVTMVAIATLAVSTGAARGARRASARAPGPVVAMPVAIFIILMVAAPGKLPIVAAAAVA
jgi:hypothetical protein